MTTKDRKIWAELSTQLVKTKKGKRAVFITMRYTHAIYMYINVYFSYLLSAPSKQVTGLLSVLLNSGFQRILQAVFFVLNREQRTCHFSKRIWCVEAFDRDHQHLSFSKGPSALLRQSSVLVHLCVRPPALLVIEEDHQHLPLSMRSLALLLQGISTCPSLWEPSHRRGTSGQVLLYGINNSSQ